MDVKIVLDSVEQLLSYGVEELNLDIYDVNYARNSILDLLRLTAPSETLLVECKDIDKAINNITEYAQSIELSVAEDKILFETRLFGFVTPAPSTINCIFDEIEEEHGDIKEATDWLFELSKANRYIRMADINKNIMWDYKGSHGDLVVTINLSKPEKDPKQIAAALKAKSGYPACMLCDTNVGFPGNAGHPARQTLRMIPVEVGGEEWFMQYSPYQYYHEHIIVLCGEHRPMKVNSSCLERLLDFVEQYPHYFLGSNAALPIVGGSILTHDHYQGGGKVLPMFHAPIRNKYKSPIRGVEIGTVDWYNSVIRIEGAKKANVLKTASFVLDTWSNYTDENVGILAKTSAQHNAITPIARYENGKFVMDMILRNNRTDEAHPYGIYHPTEDLHNIKKEGIGIIEVMGIFILPGRLDKELNVVKDILTGSTAFDYEKFKVDTNPLHQHADMINNLVTEYGANNTAELADKIVRNYINHACEKILECTAVYKNTNIGQNAFSKFMTSALNCVQK